MRGGAGLLEAERAGARLASEEAPAHPTLAGTYRIVRRLGAGATSQVFEVEHVRLGSRMAAKVLKRELATDPRALARFCREARTLAAMTEDNVVRVFDLHEDDELPFFVMERLQGRDLLSELNAEGALEPVRALHIALDVCRGLSALHRKGLVHRDVKPANLFLTCNSRGREVCKILDLGVARGADVQTHDRALVGTLRYMAPEQIVDSASVGPTADVYATAAVLYHSVTGRAPHGAQTVEALMFEILNRTPTPPAKLRPNLPRGLNELILGGLNRNASQRPASILEFARELEEVLELTGSQATNDTLSVTISEAPVPSSRRARSIRPWLRAATAGAVLTLLAGALRLLSLGAPQPSRMASLSPINRTRPATGPVVHPELPTIAPSLPSAEVHSALAPAPDPARAPTQPAVTRTAKSASKSAHARLAAPAMRVPLGEFDERNPYEE